MTGIIYLAVCRANGKQYVGKTMRDFGVRIREHEYDARNKGFTPFSRAIRKHGLDNFDFAVLEECEASSIDARERYWISLQACRKPHGYNLTSGGDGTLGIKRPDVTARLKAMTGEKNHMHGRTFTPEERKRFGQPGRRNARFGVRLTPQFRQLISERTKAAMARPDVRAKFMATRGKISEETLQKMRQAARLRVARAREKKA